jgi:hypothetical protein
MKPTPQLIITVVYVIAAFVLMVLMGMEIISNRVVTDRLMITIPLTGLAIIGYWFSKSKNGSPPVA